MKKIILAVIIVSFLMLGGCEMAGKATGSCPPAMFSPASNGNQLATSVSECYNNCNVPGCILEKIEYMDSWKGKGPTIKCTCKALPKSVTAPLISPSTEYTYTRTSEGIRQPTPLPPTYVQTPTPTPTPTPRPSGGTQTYPQYTRTPTPISAPYTTR